MATTAGNYARIQALIQYTEGKPCTSSGKLPKSTIEACITGQMMAGCRGTGSDHVILKLC